MAAERLLTPTKITAWLGCAHSLSLTNEVAAGRLHPSPTPLGELAEVLIDKGVTHEQRCLEEFEANGQRVYEVPGRDAGESFHAWVERVGNPLTLGYDVIYQMPFIHDGVRGIADFLVRVDDPEVGRCFYEPVDAKLTRARAKPGHVLQLCFYAEALEVLTSRRPRSMHLWLGSGVVQALSVDEYLPYWRRLRRQLATLLNEDDGAVHTTAKPCDTCEYCEFHDHCERQWRREDSLAFVANARERERDTLERAGITTVVALAGRREPVVALHEEKLERLVRQATLQVRSREDRSAPPAFELIEAREDPVYGHGFEQLPEPDDGDVFFDFEGDPFWSAQSDLLFLGGLYYRRGSEWSYDARWAHTLADQQRMVKGLVEFFAERRESHPAMHVYHYNHTERSAIERLTRDADDENLFASLVDSGLFVDLFAVAKNAVRVGVESYGLKHLEHLVSFERHTSIEQGAGAVVEYEAWLSSGDPTLLENIARYNRDDVAATLALRDWLVSQRPAGTAWREAVFVKEPYDNDIDELVEALHANDETSPEYLLGDLLNYWRRERSADETPKFVALRGDQSVLYDEPDVLANLSLVGIEEPTGRQKVPGARFTWPPQPVDASLAKTEAVLYAGPGVPFGRANVRGTVDLEGRGITLTWGASQSEAGVWPLALTPETFVRPYQKVGALKQLARQVLSPEESAPSRLALALLEAAPPRFVDGAGPRDGLFSDDLDSIYEWVAHLDESVVAFQGPPGTGKTHRGSHAIHHLLERGLRVGVTAMSHHAIDNLLVATERVFREAGHEEHLRVLRWQDRQRSNDLDFVTYSRKDEDLEGETFNLLAGTAWLWAKDVLRQHRVDVLVVDEAGQLSLADALASANGARNMILLGDPLQLSQVAKAEHPGRSGDSVLELLLGEHPTIPATQGVFMSQTRRMHPDVCAFISEQIYEGRLTSHESCARQATAFGTGLRWLRAEHEGRSTESIEEADLVAEQIESMVTTPWTDQHGREAPLAGGDFMVVAPYNDQVDLIRRVLAKRPGLAGVQVGTVDKFQGREAPVVFFTMTTSSAADMPRGPEFLFSRNRLNVAVSRARCLAYLVSTEELLNSRASDLESMRLISTLCAFVEYVDAHRDEAPRLVRSHSGC